MEVSAERIKNLRLSAGLSQEQLADAIGAHVKSIQRYETRRFRPDTHILIALAVFFGVSADYLLGLSDIKLPATEEQLLLQQGRYGAFYRDYLGCISDYTFHEDAVYYWISLEENGDFGGQGQWVGWADEACTLEIRRLRPVIPQLAVEWCEERGSKPMVLNSRRDAEVFRVFGGNAIVREDICREYLPEFYADYIGPNPEKALLRGL